MSWLAQGFCYNVKELMANLDKKRLSFKGKECIPYTHDQHKDEFAACVFLTHFYLVIDDIIDNNATFHVPRYSKLEGVIKPMVMRGGKFKSLFHQNVFPGLDPMKSYFTGTIIIFSINFFRKPYYFPLITNSVLKERIAQNQNNGMVYGDGKKDTNWKDYMEDVYKKFPTIPKKDLRYIVNFGWKNFFRLRVYGIDIKLRQGGKIIYIGRVFKEALDNYDYYCYKLLKKMIYLNSSKNTLPMDNKYYIYLTELENKKLKEKNPHFRMRGYRNKEMASLDYKHGVHVYSLDVGQNPNKMMKIIRCDDIDNLVYEGKRKPTTFQYIQDNIKKYKV